jgi:hypothetical protein
MPGDKLYLIDDRLQARRRVLFSFLTPLPWAPTHPRWV